MLENKEIVREKLIKMSRTSDPSLLCRSAMFDSDVTDLSVTPRPVMSHHTQEQSLLCHSAMFDSDVTTRKSMTSLDKSGQEPSLLCHSQMHSTTDDEGMTSQFDIASCRMVRFLLAL